ncbi:MAG: Fe-S oxidoreductase [Gammaproteobacteria bacterium 28-57-27]|nr:MAG: Fe-S oxidoreductase [Gammaproteobacteria bacterium 28-57-27]
MQNLKLEATSTSPEVDFQFSEHRLALRGESYPENAAAFFGPIVEALNGYLEQTQNQVIEVIIELTYFNSSSTKVLFNVFNMLNFAAASNTINLHWRYDEDDDTILEFGDDLHEDFPDINYIPESFAS